MKRNYDYIEDIYFGRWDYDVKNNSTARLGKYYETREEALKAFQI